jgi:hypothetical protein
VLYAMLVWGGRHRRPNSRLFRHAVCGTELSQDASCRQCDLAPDVGDIITEPRPRRGRLRDDPVAIALRAPHRLLESVRAD